MKWRECRNREMWYTGPTEGKTYWTARKGGVTFTVRAGYSRPMTRSGDVLWWALCAPAADNRPFPPREAAIAYCERAAGVTT